MQVFKYFDGIKISINNSLSGLDHSVGEGRLPAIHFYNLDVVECLGEKRNAFITLLANLGSI